MMRRTTGSAVRMLERYRRTIGVAALAMLTAIGTLAGSDLAGAQPDVEEFVAGSGRADARVVRVGPSAGRLGLTPSVSLALADFLGTVGRGESRIFDFAALEDSVPEEVRAQFPALRVESTEEGADEGRSSSVGPFNQHAQASEAPSGRSVTSIDALSIPGVVEVSGGRAESFAGLTEEGGRPVREAGGVVDIGRVDLAGGAVVLRGLHWDVRQTTDENDDPTPTVAGRFVIGSATVGGETTDGPISGAELAPLFDAVNQALQPTGLVLDEPVIVDRDGVGRVTPLAVRIVNSDLGRTVLAPVLEAAQPGREAVVTPLLQQCPDCSAAVLVGDVAVGVVSGSGRLDIELGGAFAFTEGEVFDNPFLGGFGGFEPVDAPPADRPSTPGVTGTGPAGTHGQLGAAAAPANPTGDPTDAAAPPAPGPRSDRVVTRPASRTGTSPASAAWAVGLLGLGSAAAMALTEYRQLRARRLELPS